MLVNLQISAAIVLVLVSFSISCCSKHDKQKETKCYNYNGIIPEDEEPIIPPESEGKNTTIPLTVDPISNRSSIRYMVTKQTGALTTGTLPMLITQA